MDRLLTIREAAEIIGVSTETLRRWDKSGKFTSSRNPINNYRVYKIDKVNQFVKELKFDYHTKDDNEKLGQPSFELIWVHYII